MDPVVERHGLIYKVGKGPPVKTDLAIDSLTVDMSG